MAEILKQVIKISGKPVTKLSEQLGMSQQNLNKMKSNKSEDFTIPMAIMIENGINIAAIELEYKGKPVSVCITVIT